MLADRDPGGAAARWWRAYVGLLADARAAFALLTPLPGPRPAPSSAAFGHAALFFPIVGLCMGVLLNRLDALLAIWLTSGLASVLLIAAWIGLSRGQTVQAVAATAAQLGRTRAWGVIAAGAAIAIKTAALALHPWARPGARPAAVLFAPLLGRWAIVVLATGARAAAAPGTKFNSHIGFQQFAIVSVVTFTLVFGLAEAFGILIVVWTAALTLALRLLLHRLASGVSWPSLLASVEVLETAAVAFLVLW